MDRVELRTKIEAKAHELGFALVGVARASPSSHGDALRRWIAQGKHGEMDWLADCVEERVDVRTMLRNARSVIAVADRYHDGRPDCVEPGARGRIARYARGKDYHDLIRDRLRKLGRFIRACVPDAQTRLTGDIHPILEREQAARALLGAIGKHTLLIRPAMGSWFMLGEIITDADIAASDEAPRTNASSAIDETASMIHAHDESSATRAPLDLCGSCTRCIDACPTKAITPWSVDARRCTAYLTIEHRGAIDSEYFGITGDWWFGCDICQEVCPHAQPTRASKRAGINAVHAPRLDSVDLLEVLGWSESDRARLVVSSALKRASLEMMKRNALLALASIARSDSTLALNVRARCATIANDESESEIVRAAATATIDALG